MESALADSMLRRLSQQRLEALAPLRVADGAAEELLENRARRGSLLVRDEAHGRHEEMAQQLGIEPCHDEGTLEGPDGALRVAGLAAGTDRLEQAFWLDVVPVHALSIASDTDLAFAGSGTGYGNRRPSTQEKEEVTNG